jgi:small subunit ribosomal protein S2
MKDLERKLEEGSNMTKKEKLKAKEELRKLNANLGGILDITKVPDALYVVDTVKEMTAVKEARKIGIPIIAIADTNVNPDMVDYPIPANDDAVKTIKIITEYMAEAIGKVKVKSEEVQSDKGAEKKEGKPASDKKPEKDEKSVPKKEVKVKATKSNSSTPKNAKNKGDK